MTRALLVSGDVHLRPTIREPLELLGVARMDHAEDVRTAIAIGRATLQTGEGLAAIVIDGVEDHMLAFDLLDALGDEGFARETPKLVLIERARAASIDVLMFSGADDVLLSPFSAPELKLRIQLAQRLRAEVRERRAVAAALEALRTNGGLQAAAHDPPSIDPTTGLFNRAAAEAFLRVLSAGSSQRLRFSVVALSVDALEGYGASQGVSAIRPLLRALADALMTLEAPLGSVIFRYDDDTLIILMLDAPVGRTASLARACFESVIGMRWLNPGSSISRHVTASIGFS
ncbi:MAG: diguanylate cyclase domain-containing protein, partial [Beijerinckiaceae bacterium]